MRLLFTILALLLGMTLAIGLPSSAQASTSEPLTWTEAGDDGQVVVKLYMFWSLKCPHCRDALPHVLAYGKQHDWLQVIDLEITGMPENRDRFRKMADALGLKASSVPTFFVCGHMLVGWDNPQGMGQMLLQTAQACHAGAMNGRTSAQQPELQLQLPFGWQPEQLSLPLFTLVIAALDAFNPCAFFILLFLLSLLVHARSRRRMLLVGLTFVLISGVVYFLFMAAWLNLFLLVGSMPWITTIAGLLALVIGVVNSREILVDKASASLSIPDSAKPGLYHRMGRLLSVDRLPTLLAGTVMLAIAVNSYELLCTAGFPMVYTRTLTLHELDTVVYYLYLGFYNLIYVIPLMAIVVAFTWTLGARKLSQNEGKALKLLSGLMMLMLGLLLIFAPQLLSNVVIGIALMALAVLLTILITRVKRRAGHSDP